MTDGLPYFVRYSVIGFGFVSGVWIAVGVNPETEIIRFVVELADSIHSGIGVFFWIIPIIIFAVSLFIAVKSGGWLGLIAVFIAFLSGALCISHTVVAVILALVALGLGIFFARY